MVREKGIDLRKPLIRTRGGGVRAGGGSNPSDAPEPATRYNITVTSSNTSQGTVTGGGTYTEGDTVTLRATAKTGYKFTGWYNGNSKVSGNNPYTFTASQDLTLVARFAEVQADFYYGAVVPDATSGNAYDKANVISELTKGWITGNTVTTPEITIAAGRKFIVLYNSDKVTPTYMKLGEDLSDPNQYEEFDNTGINNPRNFNQGVVAETYTSFEGKVTVATGDVQYFQVTFTKV